MSVEMSRHLVAAIPAFNEAGAIERVVARTLPHVDQVIVIDDGSTDATAERALAAGAMVIRHEQNLGKAAGIMSAFQAATDCGADILVLLDGDGQHDPDEIPALVEPIRSGQADVVVGSRFLDIRNPIPFYRTIGQRVLNVASHIGSGLKCSDSQCGYRALHRRAFTSITLRERFLHGLAVESEMQFEIATRGLRLSEVPIYVSYDERARRNPARHGFSVLYRVIAMTVDRRKGLAYSVAAGTAATTALLAFVVAV